jgi:RNA polymerase sigma factor (sigma-70 family)
MEAAAATAAPADEALDARASAGDREAFRSLYGPHFEGVYDYVLRVVRDREVAADIVRTTFAQAWHAFPEQGNEVSAWLFTTARACALDVLRYRRDRNGSDREALDFTQVDGNRVPDASTVFDKELVELVWDAAAVLPRDEYSLLALQLRHDLTTDAIGEEIGLNGGVSTRLLRTRDSFEETVTTELVARRGRHNCTELDIVLSQGDARDASHHIRRCARCHESKGRYVSPAEVLRGLAPMAPTRNLRQEIFGGRRRRQLFGIL